MLNLKYSKIFCNRNAYYMILAIVFILVIIFIPIVPENKENNIEKNDNKNRISNFTYSDIKKYIGSEEKVDRILVIDFDLINGCISCQRNNDELIDILNVNQENYFVIVLYNEKMVKSNLKVKNWLRHRNILKNWTTLSGNEIINKSFELGIYIKNDSTFNLTYR